MIGNSNYSAPDAATKREEKTTQGLRALKRSRYGYLLKAQSFWAALLTRTGTKEHQKMST